MKHIIIAIFLTIFCSSSIFSKDFTWQNLSILYSKVYPNFIYDEHVRNFIFVFFPQKWKTYKEDEFLFEENKSQYIDLMKKFVSEYDVNDTYKINTTVILDKYDFSKQIFPIKRGFSNTTYFPETSNYSREYPKTFKLFFKNPEFIKGLKLNKIDAKKFVESNKDTWGKVNRKVSILMEVKILGFKESGNYENFIGEIISYEYDI